MKRLFATLLLLPLLAQAQIQDINIGTANAGQGDSLYTAFGKVNDNFDYLDSLTLSTGTNVAARIVADLDTMASLSSATVNDYVVVADTNRGGIFQRIDTISGTNTGTRFDSNVAGKSYQRVYQGPINVKWFGATGDGSTDDTTSISNAFAAASSLGQPVYIPDGDFLITSQLELWSGANIFGSEKGTITTATTNINCLYGTNLTGINISGVRLSGPGKGSVGSGATTSGILIEGSSRIRITGVEATGFPWDGIGLSECFSFRVTDNRSKSCRVGINIYRSYDGVVANNRVDLNGFAGAQGGGILLYTPGDFPGEVYGITCTGNSAVNNNYHGIFAENLVRSTIIGNICSNNGESLGSASGIAVHFGDGGAATGVTISGNEAHLNRDHGIVVQNVYDLTNTATGITISGNVATGNQKCGIRLINQVDDSIIIGNTCNSNGTGSSATGYRNGIMVAAGCNRNIIANNICRDNPEDGIKITDENVTYADSQSGENLITGNILYNNAGYGINLATSTTAGIAERIIGNHIRNNSSGAVANTHTYTTRFGNSYSFTAQSGSGSLSSGTGTFSTSDVQTHSLILLQPTTAGSGTLTVTNIVAGTSFTVGSSDGSDARTVKWQLIH